MPRPLHLRAIDRLASLGNRSVTNPFLARSFDLFFGPFGITARAVEFSAISAARGHTPPLYLTSPKFDFQLVRQSESRLTLFKPLEAALGAVEVSVKSPLSLLVHLRPSAETDHSAAAGLKVDLMDGFEARVNEEIQICEGYFRVFVAGIVPVLARENGDADLQALFLDDPAAFADRYARRIAG